MGNWFTVAILTGALAGDAMATTMERFGDGSATREAASLSLNDQLVALHRPEVLDRTWSHVAGEISGRQILRLRLHDLIVHSWDVEETLRAGASLAEISPCRPPCCEDPGGNPPVATGSKSGRTTSAVLNLDLSEIRHSRAPIELCGRIPGGPGREVRRVLDRPPLRA